MRASRSHRTPRHADATSSKTFNTGFVRAPNQLGVDDNAHAIESILTFVAPELSWRQPVTDRESTPRTRRRRDLGAAADPVVPR